MPIEIIVPFRPGGGYDAVARRLATPMEKICGQPVVINNVPGGGQRSAARQFQQSTPDGYTLIFASDTTLYVDTLINPTEDFDLNSWIWVAGVRKSPAFVAVGKDSPWKSIQDVVAADPDGKPVRMGHNGVAGFLPTEVAFTSSLGLKNVTYVGGFTGAADITPALARGDIDIAVFSPISSTLPFVQTGDLRPLMVMEGQRSPLLLQVPTARELGLANVDDMERAGSATSGIASPPGLSEEIRAWAKTSGVETDLMRSPGAQFSGNKKREYDTWMRYEAPIREAAAGSSQS
jgi:tripartite-type tricarboxylate transporter receptor subunit TctC